MYGANTASWQCRQQFESEIVLQQLSQKLVAQPSAIAAIDALLSLHPHNGHHHATTGIVLAGASGVGKSLTASIFRNHWQWQRNVQSISVTGVAVAQFKEISDRVCSRLNDCGHNLVVIDNILDPSDIRQLHGSLLLQLTDSQAKYKVIVIYVINVASYTDDDDVAATVAAANIDQLTNLSEMDGLTVIPYAAIDENGLRECIRLECDRRSGVRHAISDERMQMIVQSIDVKRSGCKHVHTKVALYA